MTYNWQTRERGSGPVVILLHAFPFDGRMWDLQMSALAASHRVVVPDMPGFHGSPSWTETPSMDAWASGLLGHLKAMDISDAAVAGCSMGGYLAFAMLRVAPHFIRGLALVDTRAVADTPERRLARLADADKIAREGRSQFIVGARNGLASELAAYPAALAGAGSMLDDASASGIMNALVAMGDRPDARPQLASVGVPVAVLRGALDPIVGSDEARALAEAIPGATFAEIEGAGHIPTFQRPETVTGALFGLLARC